MDSPKVPPRQQMTYMDDDPQPPLHHLESKMLSDWANCLVQGRGEDVPQPKDIQPDGPLQANLAPKNPPKPRGDEKPDKDVHPAVDTSNLDCFSLVYPIELTPQQRKMMDSTVLRLLDFFDCDYILKETKVGLMIYNKDSGPDEEDQPPPLEEPCPTPESPNQKLMDHLTGILMNGLVINKKIGKGSVKIDYLALKIHPGVGLPDEPLKNLLDAYNWLIKKSPSYRMIKSLTKLPEFP
nr:phosphoprotein [Walnut Creek virus]